MKQKILDILAIQKKAVSYSYLKEELHIETKEDFTLFMKTINQCIDDLEIVETDQHELVLLEYSNLLKGILRINRKGFGFVDGEEQSVYIHERNLHGALDEDEVLVCVQRNIMSSKGKIIEPQEIKIKLEKDVDCAMAISAILLIYEK